MGGESDIKENSLQREKLIPDGYLALYKEMKNKIMTVYIIFKSSFFKFFHRYLAIAKKNHDALWNLQLR